jgi:hypothetical protein
MKTAVEYLIEELRNDVIGHVSDVKLHVLIENALAMEKEQMEKVWVAGLYCETGDRQAFIEYYNETFKSE